MRKRRIHSSRLPTGRAAAATLAGLCGLSILLSPIGAQAAQGTADTIRSIEQRLSLIEGDILALTSDRHRRMTVPVTISGEGPFDFMVDTGAQATVITPELSQRFAMPPAGMATVVGMSSRRQVQLVDFDGLEFAGRQIDNLQAPLLQGHHIGADGILGLDSLQDLRVIIDFRTRTMTVADAYDDAANDGFEIVVRARRKLGQMIITNAEVDGVRTAVIIDTGAQGSVGNMALQKRLRARSTGLTMATDVNGVTTTSDVIVAGQVRIANINLSRVPLSYADGPAFEALGLGKRPALILGMQNLRSFERVAIDFATREVLFDLPGTQERQRKVRPNSRATRIKRS